MPGIVRTTLLATATLLLVIAGCASRGQLAEPPDVFDREYEVYGNIEGLPVTGTLVLMPHPAYAAEYEFTYQGQVCRSYINSLTASRVQIGCQGFVFDFLRAGRIRTPASATLRTVREVERRECAEWRVDPQTGQRSCVRFQTVRVPVNVTLRGYVDVRPVGGEG